MEALFKYASPIESPNELAAWLFILLPALGAMLGALVGQGSFMRIPCAALGAALRDLTVIGLVAGGLIEPNNSFWSLDISVILVFFSAASGALGSCLAPYRGKLLLFNAAVGGFAGQFLLQYVLGMIIKVTPLEEEIRNLLKA